MEKEDDQTVEEMNTLLLLDHNEDSEPFPRRLLEKSVTFVLKFCSISRHFFPLHAINCVRHFPSCCKPNICSSFVKHFSLPVYLYEYVVVGHVACMSVCMLEGYVHVR